MASLPPPETAKELAQKALQANKDHQYALKLYTERLEAELEAVDKLLVSAELPEDDLEVDAGGSIIVPNAVKAAGLVGYERSLENHPFAEAAEKRQRYLQATVIHQLKAPELETLAEAVRAENYRIYALDAQRRGQQVFFDPEAEPDAFLSTNKVGIDWERVASKVSAAGSSNVRRTAQECEIRWLGDRHPELNHSSWSQQEITRVKELVGDAVQGQIDWVDIAARLGTHRTPVDCMRHAITRKTHTWSAATDKRLLEAVQIYGTGSWLLVARYVSEDVTAAQCQARYTRSLDPNNKRGSWSEEEDAQLRRAVEVFGRSWIEVCTFVPTRSSEQCRDRWQEVLNPGCGRGKWGSEEDAALLEAYKTVGEGRWKEISNLVGTGRTDNMCRHRYANLMKRKTKSASTSATASSAATPDTGRVAAPIDDQQPVAGPSTHQSQDTRNAGPADPQTSGPSAPPTAQSETSNVTPPADQDSNGSTATPKSKPRPKPRPRRRVTPAEATLTNTPSGADLQSTSRNGLADGAAGEQPTAASVPTSAVEAETETGDIQPAPRRRGRPRKTPKRPAEDSEESRPLAKKSRTTKSVPEKSVPAPADSVGIVSGPQTASTSAEPSRRSKGNNRRGSARTSAEPTRRSARRSGRHQSAEGKNGDAPGPDAVVDGVDMTEGSPKSAQEEPPNEEGTDIHRDQVQTLESEDPGVQTGHASKSTSGKRGRGRGKPPPAPTRTLRSSTRNAANPSSVQEAQDGLS